MHWPETRWLLRLAVIGCSFGLLPLARSEWSLTTHGTMFYTDDVGVFSATRRLTLDGDPTQPALDNRLTGQGSDAVFEPMLDVARSFASDYGKTTFEIRGQGFVYVDQTRYSHGTLRFQALQEFSAKTAVLFRYYFAPDLFLGENEVRVPGLQGEHEGDESQDTGAEPIELAAERVSSQIGSLRVSQELTDGLELRLLGRYGTRRYNEKFQQRNLNFWTLGPHVAWRLGRGVKWVLGYHYERGTANGVDQPLLADDVSYINNYVSTELEIEFAERFTLITGLHFERNDWTSALPGDERNGAFETIWQGEALLVYRMTEKTKIYGGVQHSSRSENIRPGSVPNTNVALGIQASF
jgi:hypothetical protein